MTLDGGILPPGLKSGTCCIWLAISPQPSGHTTRAMPLLAEMSALLGQPSIRDVFGTVQRDNSAELLLDYIRRALDQGHSDYPMMSGCTRFMLSPDTRVVAS